MKDVQNNLSLLLEVELPLTVSFGQALMPIREILQLSAGSIVELDSAIDQPVSLIINNHVIARGSAVVIDGSYGVRIEEVISRQDRLLLDSKTEEKELTPANE
jgi:flagellar motor switch protein FliN/FliY